MRRNKLPRQHLSAITALLIATAIWAGALPIIKITLDYIPPFSFLLMRFLAVTILLLPITVIELKKTPVHPKDIKNLFLLGLFGQASLALVFLGVKYTTAVDSAIISTVSPLLVIFAGHHFYNEKVNCLTKVGVLIASFGTIFVVLEPILSSGSSDHAIILRLYGNLLIVGSTISFTIYSLFAKVVMGKSTIKIRSFLKHIHVEPMKRAYSPTLSTSLTFYVGLLAAIPLAIAENLGYFGTDVFIASNFTLVPILGVLYMAVLSSIVAYIAYEWGLHNAAVTDSAIFGYLGPLFTIPFSYLLLSEVPNGTTIIGALIITVGVILAEKYKNAKDCHLIN